MSADQLKEILSNRLINAAAVAVQVFPKLLGSSAKKTLIMKVNGAKHYTLTEQDLTGASGILRTFADQLKRTKTDENSILEILSNPILKRSAIAEQLYPNSSSRSATTIFSNRVQGRNFAESERAQIAEVLHELSSQIGACFEVPALPDEGRQSLEEILSGAKINPNIFASRKRDADQDD